MVRRKASKGWPDARAMRTPEDVRSGVVHPHLARLVHERQRAEAADPLVGNRQGCGSWRTHADLKFTGGFQDRGRREA